MKTSQSIKQPAKKRTKKAAPAKKAANKKAAKQPEKFNYFFDLNANTISANFGVSQERWEELVQEMRPIIKSTFKISGLSRFDVLINEFLKLAKNQNEAFVLVYQAGCKAEEIRNFTSNPLGAIFSALG